MASEAAIPQPTYLYKILSSPPPTPMPETLPPTALDAKDGFIHLSSASHVPITANLFFPNCDQLWILKLRAKDLDGRLEYQTENGIAYPHVHDSQKGLGSTNVEETIEMNRAKDQNWMFVEAMRKLED